jgi:glycolate oxidase
MNIEISPEIHNKLIEILGNSYVFLDLETRNHYGHDETEDYVFPPNVVVKPANALEISEIMKLANFIRQIRAVKAVVGLVVMLRKMRVVRVL